MTIEEINEYLFTELFGWERVDNYNMNGVKYNYVKINEHGRVYASAVFPTHYQTHWEPVLAELKLRERIECYGHKNCSEIWQIGCNEGVEWYAQIVTVDPGGEIVARWDIKHGDTPGEAVCRAAVDYLQKRGPG